MRLLVPHETAAVLAHSVYTIQPCTMSLHAKPCMSFDFSHVVSKRVMGITLMSEITAALYRSVEKSPFFNFNCTADCSQFRPKPFLSAQILSLPSFVWKKLVGETTSWTRDFPTVDAAEVR